jgi:hypothetical protein
VMLRSRNQRKVCSSAIHPPKILHEVSDVWTQGSAPRSQCIMASAIDLTSKELGFNSWQGWRFFSYSLCVGEPRGLPSLLSIVYQGLFLGVYLSEHAANHSCPSSAEVKMTGAIPPLPYASSLPCPPIHLHIVTWKNFI